MAKKDSIAPSGCRCCKEPVGDKPKVAPFFVQTDDGLEPETHCPACFVYVRCPLEPLRFHQGHFIPVHCGSCGWDSVAVGRLHCGQCGSRIVVILPKKVAA